ncbi:MAG: hypothetical protein H8E34_02045 [Bacteroidetes bacterium]|nr:hypothetical protein [Bacteroidota bacterium]MBL6944015.1 hypothetical protein [Bacteroidales bacterium]
MSKFVNSWQFFKNAYSKPYIVRMQFSIKVSANCTLVADNMCRCDHWFSRDGNAEIKYDIINDGNIMRPHEEIIEKSIVVDLGGPYTALSKMVLLVSNGNEKSESISILISDAPDDPLSSN